MNINIHVMEDLNQLYLASLQSSKNFHLVSFQRVFCDDVSCNNLLDPADSSIFHIDSSFLQLEINSHAYLQLQIHSSFPFELPQLWLFDY
jgi:hypothetical protein